MTDTPTPADTPESADAVKAWPATGERVAKVMARAGVASRREAEALIAAGRVKVNGVTLETPATLVTDSDEIRLDNDPIPRRLRTRAWAFNKPKGLVTTNKDPEGRATVFDALPSSLPRVVTVGRLDINTEGLLLLTNDGGLARVLELPATGWTRKYRVRVHGAIDEGKLADLKNGIAVDGMLYGPIEVTVDRAGENSWLTVALTEGKNREIKVVLGALGLQVTRLLRVSFGPFQLGDLARGEIKEIPTRYLKDQLGERLAVEAAADFDAPLTAGVRGKAPTGRPPRPAREADDRNSARRDRPADRDARPARGTGAPRQSSDARPSPKGQRTAKSETNGPQRRTMGGPKPAETHRDADVRKPFEKRRPVEARARPEGRSSAEQQRPAGGRRNADERGTAAGRDGPPKGRPRDRARPAEAGGAAGSGRAERTAQRPQNGQFAYKSGNSHPKTATDAPRGARPNTDRGPGAHRAAPSVRRGPAKGAANTGVPNKGTPNRDAPNRGTPTKSAPNRGTPNRGAPSRDTPNKGAPNKGRGKPTGPRTPRGR